MINVSKRFKYVLPKRNEKKKIKVSSKKTIVVNDVSINVKKGEVLGIIGKNGCGKSTLLKIMAGIYPPTTGEVITQGMLVSTLELSMGFESEMTGRENIYLKGELYGLSKSEIDSKMDDIIDYSGLGDKIDDYLLYYSSGQSGRLAFSIMAHAGAEIILIDEVLSVGDTSFRIKANQYLKRASENGITVVIVSHDLDFIKKSCSRTIWMDEGKIYQDGPTETICNNYETEVLESFDIVYESAKSGYAPDQYKLACMYRDGIRVDQNRNEYIIWLKKAADLGYSLAEIEYADYLLSLNPTDNRTEAISLYDSAAKSGNSAAKLKLSRAIVSQNDELSNLSAIFEKIAEMGDPLCQLKYGEFIQKMARVPEDNVRAFDWIKKASDSGNTNAMITLANMYIVGIGTKKDVDLAYNLYEKASEKNDVRAQMTFASLLLSGKIFKQDFEKAFYWYNHAALVGNQRAQYQIAEMYRQGIGTDIDINMSRFWFDVYFHSSYSNYEYYLASTIDKLNLTDLNSNDLYLDSMKSLSTSIISRCYTKVFDPVNKNNLDFLRLSLEELSKYDDANGQINLANYYMMVESDPQKAKTILSEMCNKSGGMAEFMLYQIENTEGNKDLALQYLKSSANQGNRRGVIVLNRIVERENSPQITTK